VRVLIVWKADYPWDVRVEKMAASLSGFGHHVHILARNLEGSPLTEEIDGVKVHRLRAAGNRYLNALKSLPVFFNPVWARTTHRLCRSLGVDLLIVRDIPLAVSAMRVGERLGIPTVLDMAEDYPAMWADSLRGRWYLPQNYVLKNPILGRVVERHCIRRATHTLVVVEEARDRLLNLGLSSERVSVVSNTPRLEVLEAGARQAQPRQGDDAPIVFYHGYLNRARGVGTVVRAMPELISRFPRLILAVAGTGAYLERLKRTSRKLAVEQHIRWLGWLALDRIAQWISRSEVCVVPHVRTPHKDSTIPNKLFDYMSLGKPVAVSDARPLRRIVEQQQCGTVFTSNDPASCARALGALLDDEELRERLGRNGRRAVESIYNWDRDAEVLRAVVERVGGAS